MALKPRALLAAVSLSVLVQSSPTWGADSLDVCIASKLLAAGKYCRAELAGRSLWVRTQSLQYINRSVHAEHKCRDAWTRAEAKASLAGVDCTAISVTSQAMIDFIKAAVVDVVEAITMGLDLSDPASARCGAALVKMASKKCGAFLAAEGRHFKQPERDPDGSLRDAAQARASQKFSSAWAATAGGCPTTATEDAIETSIDTLSADVVARTTTTMVPCDLQSPVLGGGCSVGACPPGSSCRVHFLAQQAVCLCASDPVCGVRDGVCSGNCSGGTFCLSDYHGLGCQCAG